MTNVNSNAAAAAAESSQVTHVSLSKMLHFFFGLAQFAVE